MYAAAKVRSADRPGRAASLKSRAMSLRKPAISFALVGWRSRRLLAKSFAKLTRISQNQNLLRAHNRGYQVVFRLHLASEFVRRVDRWINRTTYFLFCFAEGARQIGEPDPAYNHQIDVAR